MPPDFSVHLPNKFPVKTTIICPWGCHQSVVLRRVKGVAYIEDGWEGFLEHHSLGNNEFLVFKYDITHATFNIEIYGKDGCKMVDTHSLAAQKCPRSNIQPPGEDEDKNAVSLGVLPLSNKLTLKPPFFRVVLHRSSLSKCLLLPVRFWREHLVPVSRMVHFKDADGRYWDVKLLFYSSKCITGKGWVDFVVEHGLKMNDVCVFEIIATDIFRFHVLDG